MSDTLNIACWVLGDDPRSSFIISIDKSTYVDSLKVAIKARKPTFHDVAASDLRIWKVSIPHTDQLPEIKSPEDVRGAREQTNPLTRLSDAFPATLADGHLHIIAVPPDSKKEDSASLPEGEDTHDPKRPRLDRSFEKSDGSERHTDDRWLIELHSKLWRCEDLKQSLFHKTSITVDDYDALQKDLQKLYPGRDSVDYISNNVLSIKLKFLLSHEFTTSSSSGHPHHYHSELGKTDDTAQSDDIDAELSSFLPATVEFLDLTTLELLHPPPRLPLPLYCRHEYELISQIIAERGSGSGGSVLVSGQPGTGKTAFLYLKVIESLIAGRAFLFQTFEGAVYHVSDKITRMKTWSSGEHIVAFVDADQTVVPQSFLRHPSVQIVAASSPASEGQAKLWRQGDTSAIFLHPQDLTVGRLQEAVYYFGLNPRQCFRASQSPGNLEHSRGEVLNKIRSVNTHVSLHSLLTQPFTTSGVSHSIFELSPANDMRLFSQARVGAVSPWVLDMLLGEYEIRKADTAADF